MDDSTKSFDELVEDLWNEYASTMNTAGERGLDHSDFKLAAAKLWAAAVERTIKLCH